VIKHTSTIVILLAAIFSSALSQSTVNYLVVYHQDFESTQWKSDLEVILSGQGHQLSFLGISDGVSKSGLRNAIYSQRTTNQLLKYVLLIGAGQDLPPDSLHSFSVGDSVSSSANGNFIPFYHYTDISGFHSEDMHTPSDQGYTLQNDILVGRVPARSLTEIGIWVDKLNTYYHDISVWSGGKDSVRILSQDNDHPSNGCLQWWEEFQIENTLTAFNDGSNNPTRVYPLSDINSTSYGTWTTNTDTYFKDIIETKAGAVIISGTGANCDNLAGFFFNTQTSDYTVLQSPTPQFIFGNTCDIGNTSHYSKQSVLQELLFNNSDGITGFLAPAAFTTEHSTLVIYNGLYETLMTDRTRTVGEIAKSLREKYYSQNVLPIQGRARGDKIFLPGNNRYQVDGMVLYGDPAMPVSLLNHRSGNITGVVSWVGSNIIDDDLTIGSGAILTIKPGTGIFVSNQKQLIVEDGGLLVIEGTEDFPVVLGGAASSPNNAFWDGILIQDGGGITINNAKITDADKGIYIYDNSVADNIVIENVEFSNCYTACYVREKDDVQISNCTFSNNQYGFLGYNSDTELNSNVFLNGTVGIRTLYSSPTLINNAVQNNSNIGIYFYGSGTPHLFNNTIQSNGSYGVYMYNNADVHFGYAISGEPGYNEIINNTSNGIYASYYCDPFLGTTDPYNQAVAGYNSVHDNGTYNLRTYNYSTAEAEWNWWDGETTWSAALYSSFDTSPTLGSEPSPNLGSTLAKGATFDGFANCPGYDFFNPDTSSECALWYWTHDLRITEQLPVALWAWELYVTKFPWAENAPKALVKIANFTPEEGRQELIGYLTGVMETSAYSDILRVKALELLTGINIKTGEFADAYTCALALLEQSLCEDQEKIALFSLIDLSQIEGLGKSSLAVGYLERLKTSYPNDELTLMAAELMGEDVDWSQMRSGTLEDEEEVLALPTKFELYQAYPNPFNPITTIRYDLPKAVPVRLTIYDITGREVTTLVRRDQVAGVYEVQWNGMDSDSNSLPSGLYLYRLHAGEFTANAKMLLLK